MAPPPPPSTAAAPAAAYPPLLANRSIDGRIAPPPPVLPPAPGQDVLAQVYAQHLRASGVTSFAGPTDPRFAAPTARPLSNFAAPVPSIVQNTYNEPLVRPMQPGGKAGSVSGATGGTYGPVAAVINFANGSARLSAKARRQIKQVSDLVRARGGAVRVIGHASSRTKNLPVAQHVVANFNVSLARGQAVARELIRRGVPPRSIFVEAKGDGEPLYLESMPSGEAHNRRVEIFLQN